MIDSNNDDRIIAFPENDKRPKYTPNKQYVRDEKGESERFRRYISRRKHKARMLQSNYFRL